MKKRIQTVRLHAVLITLAVLVPMLIAAPAALAADAAEEPLAVFRPGAPGEPSWTMLRLEVDGPGRDLQIIVDATGFRCPFSWGFILYEGEAPEVTLSRSVTIDFSYGHNGARVRVSDPADVKYDSVEHDGASACNTGAKTLGITFSQVPSGTLHLLQYKAGTPFEGFTTLRAPKGGIRVDAESSGDRVMYLGSKDFGESDTRVEFYGPQGCGSPNLDPETGFCEPGYRWAGGILPGVDVGTDRRATVAFRDRPYFSFGAETSAVSVTNATMRDPLGIIRTIYARTGIDAGPAAANAGGISYTTNGLATRHASGEYVFDIRLNANAGRNAVPWHLSGADWHFPGAPQRE